MLGIQLNVSAEGMAQTAQKLMEGYQAYAAENPQADYSGLGEAFLNYLTTDDAKAILSKHIGEIIKTVDLSMFRSKICRRCSRN